MRAVLAMLAAVLGGCTVPYVGTISPHVGERDLDRVVVVERPCPEPPDCPSLKALDRRLRRFSLLEERTQALQSKELRALARLDAHLADLADRGSDDEILRRCVVLPLTEDALQDRIEQRVDNLERTVAPTPTPEAIE